jgi:hypothetical protein
MSAERGEEEKEAIKRESTRKRRENRSRTWCRAGGWSALQRSSEVGIGYFAAARRDIIV